MLTLGGAELDIPLKLNSIHGNIFIQNNTLAMLAREKAKTDQIYINLPKNVRNIYATMEAYQSNDHLNSPLLLSLKELLEKLPSNNINTQV